MGRSLTNNLSLQYAIEASLGSLAQAVAAEGTLTFTANAIDSETVTVGSQTYEFESGGLDAADEVLLGGDLDESIDNLIAAINLGGGSGTKYDATTTKNASATAKRGPGDTIIITAITAGTAGNSIATTETSATASFGAATLEDGADIATGVVDEWRVTEPNEINEFGAQIATVARSPISKSRQRRRGTITDLDSTASFGADLTLDAFEDFIEGFVFSTAVNGDAVFRGAHVNDAMFWLQEGPLTAAQAAKFINAAGAITLLSGRGYTADANNGLLVLGAAAAENDAFLAVAGITDEDAALNDVIELAGLRTDDTQWDYDAGTDTATVTSAADVSDWSVWLTPGQFIHIGSPDGSGGVTNGFTNTAANDMFGYARVRSIAAGVMVLDKLDAALKFDDLTAQAVDYMFGRFVRNVDVDDSEYLERSFQFEAAYENLQDPGPGNEFEYSRGNFCSELGFELALADKATIVPAFIGTDTDVPTTTRKAGAATPREPSGTSAFNTVADIARLRITEVDETGISTDFKSLSFSLNNNVSAEKVLGTLGGKFMNTGNLEIDIESKLLFTKSSVVTAIRNNTELTMDFILKNDDGAIAVDIPRLTLGDGSKDYPVNESILINTTAEAYGDPMAPITTSLGVSFLPQVP